MIKPFNWWNVTCKKKEKEKERKEEEKLKQLKIYDLFPSWRGK